MTKDEDQKKNYHPENWLTKTFTQTADMHLELLKLSATLYTELLSRFCVNVNIVTSSGIEVLKQAWCLKQEKTVK